MGGGKKKSKKKKTKAQKMAVANKKKYGGTAKAAAANKAAGKAKAKNYTKDYGAASVAAANKAANKAKAAERNQKYKQTKVQTHGGTKTSYTAAEKKAITDAGYSVEGYGQASARSDAEVAAHRKQQSQFSSDRVDTKKTYEKHRETQKKYRSPGEEENNVAQKFVEGVKKIFKPITPLPKSGETSTVSSKTFGLPTQSIPTGLSLFDQPSSNKQPDVEVAKAGGLNIKSSSRRRGGSNLSNSRTVDAVASNTKPQVEPIIPPTPTSNMPTPQDIAKVQADTYNQQMMAYGVPDYSAQFQQTTPRPLKRKREYFNRDFFEQYV